MVRNGITSEKFQQVKVHEMAARPGSFKPAMTIKNCTDTSIIAYIQLSTSATTSSSVVEMVLPVDKTNAKKRGTQSEGPRENRV